MEANQDYLHKKFNYAVKCEGDVHDTQQLTASSDAKILQRSTMDKEAVVKLEPKDTDLMDGHYADLLLRLSQRLKDRICKSSDSSTSPLSVVMPSISMETLQEVCRYHGSMARKQPAKMRSSKEQERRHKNNIACRRSRQLRKLEKIVLEQHYKDLSHSHPILDRNAKLTSDEAESMQNMTKIEDTNPSRKQKCFSIEYLLGMKDWIDSPDSSVLLRWNFLHILFKKGQKVEKVGFEDSKALSLKLIKPIKQLVIKFVFKRA